MNPTTKVAFYIRSNFHGQDRMASDIQLLTEECLKQGKKLVHIYVDHGYSGNDMSRPSLNRLLDDAKNGLFNEVMTPQLKHISRKTIDLLHIVEDLQASNVSLNSPGSNMDFRKPIDLFSIKILGALASFEAALNDAVDSSSAEM
ncbi:recombinase family protein [Cohnella fermenti]|uniref:Recombinase family protein n=1 Tax=Cohnella fermenti TaxID=2565925 RepID=A0A4S4BHS4_9BACL|nr:recombinase family protein [Cohnella fermenti]THF74125.1 recombinase family protein [Cohnella fermenti]